MFIRRLNTNSNIENIIRNSPDGKEQEFLIVDSPKKELEKISKFANKKLDEGNEVFIKVKYNWDLGQRAKIIEIITKHNDIITLYKFVNDSNFDKYLLDLDRIVNHITTTGLLDNDKINICLIVKSEKIKEKLIPLILEMGITCNIEIM